mmetsp:Transcript_26450/g.66243  ORF Transcript_26450/g.66243 Transcript_26450/m.66243 type:complete len:225 (+) Transcript_26450:81-755(+)
MEVPLRKMPIFLSMPLTRDMKENAIGKVTLRKKQAKAFWLPMREISSLENRMRRSATGLRSLLYVASSVGILAPWSTRASFHPRLTASWMPVFRPWPPTGLNSCAQSPMRKAWSFWNVLASSWLISNVENHSLPSSLILSWPKMPSANWVRYAKSRLSMPCALSRGTTTRNISTPFERNGMIAMPPVLPKNICAFSLLKLKSHWMFLTSANTANCTIRDGQSTS